MKVLIKKDLTMGAISQLNLNELALIIAIERMIWLVLKLVNLRQDQSIEEDTATYSGIHISFLKGII